MVSYQPSSIFDVLPQLIQALPLTLWILLMTILGSLLGSS